MTGGLTPRETEVLDAVAGLYTNAEIAAQLFITVNTVKTHVRHILQKLGVATRGQAVRRWLS